MSMSKHSQKPNPDRITFLRSLPIEVKEKITGEEAKAFMFEKNIPESLYEKIKDFIEEEQLGKI